jgi:hypothetical protein
MGNLALFMKKNKKVRQNAFYPATKTLLDEKGNPLMWEIKPLTTEETEKIRLECTREVPVPGKKNMFRDKVNSNLYLDKMMVAAIVFPDLYNAELQDSYGVKTPEELLKKMIDDPSEYSDLMSFIQEQSGFDKDIQDEVEEAKN